MDDLNVKAIRTEVGFEGAVKAWDTPDFAAILRRELIGLGPAGLGIHRLASQTGCVDDDGMEATVLGFSADGAGLRADVGIHFTEILAGCSCADEPQTSYAYCELTLRINRATGQACVALRS